MPIKIPENLPGRATLEQERVPLIFEERALRQDIRPLQIALLNLMPDKIQTETQIIRALGGTPLQIEMTLLHTASHTSKHTPADHLSAFYKTPEDVADQRFDGMIMTGAPVGHLPFEEVTYWDELQQVMAWAEDHVYSCFFICWGRWQQCIITMTFPKPYYRKKRFGIFPHKVRDPFEPLTAGFDNMFNVPVSRHTEVDAALVRAHEALDILVESDGSGLCLVQDEAARRVFMFNHLEYDRETLKREYDRDAAAGMNPQMPCNYYPDDDPAQPPVMSWRAHRNLMFHNWINMIYQGTPFNLDALPGTPPGWDQVPNKRD